MEGTSFFRLFTASVDCLYLSQALQLLLRMRRVRRGLVGAPYSLRSPAPTPHQRLRRRFSPCSYHPSPCIGQCCSARACARRASAYGSTHHDLRSSARSSPQALQRCSQASPRAVAAYQPPAAGRKRAPTPPAFSPQQQLLRAEATRKVLQRSSLTLMGCSFGASTCCPQQSRPCRRYDHGQLARSAFSLAAIL